jgi:hypothetical protein
MFQVGQHLVQIQIAVEMEMDKLLARLGRAVEVVEQHLAEQMVVLGHLAARVVPVLRYQALILICRH